MAIRMTDLPSYAGDANPSEFTRVYEAAVSAAGGQETTMAKSLLLKFYGLEWPGACSGLVVLVGTAPPTASCRLPSE